ncbi:MAG: hypothetical protein JOS17DRAFT_171922 [Linnemannia elongata]|nr:MAG: hypothetical protein JOS17DRAFT_171922 [Linnemannia elongata]
MKKKRRNKRRHTSPLKETATIIIIAIISIIISRSFSIRVMVAASNTMNKRLIITDKNSILREGVNQPGDPKQLVVNSHLGWMNRMRLDCIRSTNHILFPLSQGHLFFSLLCFSCSFHSFSFSAFTYNRTP